MSSNKLNLASLVKALFTNKPLLVVFAGFVLTLFTFAVNILLSLDVTNKLSQGTRKIEKTYAIIGMLEEVLISLYQNEAYLRAYYITRSDDDRRLFNITINEFLAKSTNFIKGQDDNLISKDVLDEFSNLALERKDIFLRTLAEIEQKEQNTPIIKKLVAQGNDKSADIRALINDITTDLKKSIKENQDFVNKNVNYTSYTNYIAIFIALVVAIFANISITQDYLRQKEVERILRQLNDEKTKLFSILGHDLRTPFTGINGTLYLLLKHYDDFSDEEIKTYLKEMDATARSYQTLLDDVLTWSRLQMNKINLEPETIPLHDMIQSIAQIYKDQTMAKQINTINEVEKSFELTTDANMLHTVMRNIYSNAIKFSNQGGEIRFKSERKNGKVEITISDNGVGMNEMVRSRLFTNNAISMPGTANELGTGLGLAICKEFLDKVQGDILVKSEEGKGSAFIIQIPA
jgi:signal transduction histidine kinase